MSRDITDKYWNRELETMPREELEKHGMVLSGISPDGRIVEMLELSDHPFFVGTKKIWREGNAIKVSCLPKCKGNAEVQG